MKLSVPLTIRTNVTPSVTLTPGAGGGKGVLLRFLQPTIDAQLPSPLGNAHIAPYGDASDLGGLVVFGLAFLLAVGAWTVVRLIFKAR